MADPNGRDVTIATFATYIAAPSIRLPPLGVGIRRATPTDREFIAGVQRKSLRMPVSSGTLELLIADPNREVLVAIDEEVMVGWAKTHYWPEDDGAAGAGHYLGGVTVLPSHRRRGVAAALTAARLSWIWQRATSAWCLVNAQNLASIDLHKRWGFQEIARGREFHGTDFAGGTGVVYRARKAEGRTDTQ
jgi:aminoglycoside 6'-N-acetyltransferase I